MPRYSRTNLLTIKDLVPENNRIFPTLMHHIRTLGINRIPVTKRGTRAGKSKTRTDKDNRVESPLNKDAFNSSNSIGFGMLNARSLRNKTNEVIDFMIDNSLDVLGVCETWLNANDDAVIGQLTQNVYTFKHEPRLSRREGGVGVLFRKELDVHFKQHHTHKRYQSFEFIQAKIVSTSKSVQIVIIYRPPGSSCSVAKFFEEFSDFLDDCLFLPGSLVISGDFNIHFTASSPSAKTFKDLLASHGLQQHINEATHDHGQALDLFISRQSDEQSFFNLKVFGGLSDHSAIVTNLYLTKPKSYVKKVTSRNLRAVDTAAFMEDLKQKSLVEKCSNDNPDLAVDSYSYIIEQVLDNHAPQKVREIKIRPNTRWYNEEITHEKHIRKQKERQWRVTKLEIHRQLYTTQRQVVQTAMRSAQINYFNDLVDDCAQDSKRLFQLTNELLNRKADSTLPDHTNAQQLVNDFSQFYHDKVESICSTLAKEPRTRSAHQSAVQLTSVLRSLSPVTSDEVTSIVTRSATKSCDLEPLPTHLLKKCLPSIVPAIMNIINSSFEMGVMPDSLKVATVRPVLKKLVWIATACRTIDQYPISRFCQRYSNELHFLD